MDPGIPSLFGSLPHAPAPAPAPATPTPTPAAAAAAGPSSSSPTSPASAGSNNTYVMPNSPLRPGSAKLRDPGPRPRVTRTLGQRPSCLVNASLTYCGDNQIYAFGGFDQFTDEVYNQVRRLDLVSHQWTLVDNYGDIPGVRMGHTATLYQGDKLLVFGGENEHRSYLSDLIMFDIKTAHWIQPTVSGPIPSGRARHAAVLHDDKLFIIGGITGPSNSVLDDICYLDLRTFTWSRSWRFVRRHDHSAFVHNDRIWVSGGIGQDLVKSNDVSWLDLKGLLTGAPRPLTGGSTRGGYSGYSGHSGAGLLARMGGLSLDGMHRPPPNSAIAQVNTPSFQMRAYSPVPLTTVTAMRFQGPDVPVATRGIHFHAHVSGTLLDFMVPTPGMPVRESGIYALDLKTFEWQQLAPGVDTFKSGYRWHYCTLNDEGTKAWLLGSLDQPPEDHQTEELSDILEINLAPYGMLGSRAVQRERRGMAMLRTADQPSRGLSSDLGRLFDCPPDTGSGTDFVVTALPLDYDPADPHTLLLDSDSWVTDDATTTSPPIHVHRFILQARWPYFVRMWNSQMREFHTRRMHIAEPYPVVKALMHYLYTDDIQGPPSKDDSALGAGHPTPPPPGPPLPVIGALLVLTDIYDLPHLRVLCVHRLARELDVEHAALIFFHAGRAREDWLRRRAAQFCMANWGKVVRTTGFAVLPREALVELSQAIGSGGRILDEDDTDDFGRDTSFSDEDYM